MKNKVTMQDIADQLNISKNSVSQALSGKSGVSEDTRQIIIETADKLGYVYGKQKKKLSTLYSGNIGLIASEFAFSKKNFFGEIYLSIEKETSKRGMQLHIQSIDQTMRDRHILPPFIENHSVDGIIVLSHISSDYIQKVLETEIPTVIIDHHEPGLQADCILTNNRFGAFEAISHFIQLGHRDIGFIGNIDFSPSYYERMEGFRLAMHLHSLPVKPEWMITDAREELDYVTRTVGALDRQPTAWFCVNDGLGFMVHSTMQQLGFSIPGDISLCSYDNGQLSRMTTPLMTTMDIDLNRYGTLAAERLFWRIEHRNEPYLEMLLPATLIKRDSTAPVSAAAE
ncbi:substrate-binding domain-containing protein [Marinicrinis sediminis]|uniref:Substrate-binding domain-containing protein n=1 Tax=Marinicrinis sediminis TaxID=1652465 RepID=A0ABW5RBB8_9BACL